MEEDEEEEDLTNLPMMRRMEPTFVEEPTVATKDSFEDLHLEGQEIDMTSRGVVEVEGLKSKATSA